MGELYRELADFQTLYAAFREVRASNGRTKESIRFEMNLAQELWNLQNELASGSYHPGRYFLFYVTVPKLREIHALPYRDRVVQQAVCARFLKPWFENRLIYDCAACRENKGTHFAMDRFAGFLRSFYRQHGTDGYVLKCDIRKYFDSIDHTVLKKRLEKYPDPELRAFLYQIIDGYESRPDAGLPLGNQSSQWFALYYLDPVDRLVKERLRIKYYSRYMDDFVLVHEDKEYLKYCRTEIEALLSDLKLEFNEKTQIFPLKQGVDYLGFHFYLTETGKVIKKLRTSNKRHMKRRLRAMRRDYAEGKLSLEDTQQILSSYMAHLKHGHTDKLRQKVWSSIVLVRSTPD